MLVNVMRKAQAHAEPYTQLLEHVRDRRDVARFLEHAGRREFRYALRSDESASAVAPKLAADHAEALLLEGMHLFFQLLVGGTVGMRITRNGRTDRAAQKLVHGHPRFLPLDVPQRHVDTAHGGMKRRAVAPITARIHRLPQVLDLACVPSDKHRCQQFLNDADHSSRLVDIAGRADAVQSVLVRHDFNDDPASIMSRSNAAYCRYFGHTAFPSPKWTILTQSRPNADRLNFCRPQFYRIPALLVSPHLFPALFNDGAFIDAVHLE
ncbi:hypothetical protein ABIE48_005635 [Paenibacillus sp. OAE614]